MSVDKKDKIQEGAKHNPPKWATKLLAWYCNRELVEEIEGDLNEAFQERVLDQGLLKAQIFYIIDVIFFFKPFTLQRDLSQYSWALYVDMLKNYSTIALGNLLRFKTFSIINISGLSMAIASCLLIFLYAEDELSFDKHFKNANQIYRITNHFTINGKEIHTAMTPAAWGPQLKADFPQIRETVRIYKTNRQLVSMGKQQRRETNFYYADPSYFKLFSYSFLDGNPKTALDAPYSLVVTRQAAINYFGHQDVVGKKLQIGSDRAQYQITGVLADSPHNSHLTPQIVASLITLNEPFLKSWTLHNSLYTYLQIDKEHLINEIQNQFNAFFKNHLEPSIQNRYHPKLQALEKIYLHSDLLAEISPNSSIHYIYLFVGIAFLLLVIACINFVNLLTTQTVQRAKLIGLSKMLGTSGWQLSGLFFIEVIFHVVLALNVAIVLVVLLLPFFNELTGKQISLAYLGNYRFWLFAFSISLLVCVGIGIHSIIFISRIRSLGILKKHFITIATGGRRKALIVLQFTLSLSLILATLIISKQMQFITQKRLGFIKNQLLVIPLTSEVILNNYEAFRKEILNHPNISYVGASSVVPGGFFPQQYFQARATAQNKRLLLPMLAVDYHFLKTLDVEIVQGRNFSQAFASDSSAFIINEAAAKKLGFTEPLGQQLQWWQPSGEDNYKIAKQGTIVGVVKDFHFASLHQAIEPLIIHILPSRFSSFTVRVEDKNTSQTLDWLENKWHTYEAHLPFEYSFLEEDLSFLYESEKRTEDVFKYFSFLAIVIVSLGVWGFLRLTLNRHTKERAIGKVIGIDKTSTTIKLLILKDFIGPLLVAALMAWPIAYLSTRQWLQRFAYRVEINGWIYILVCVVVLLVILVFKVISSKKARLIK